MSVPTTPHAVTNGSKTEGPNGLSYDALETMLQRHQEEFLYRLDSWMSVQEEKIHRTLSAVNSMGPAVAASPVPSAVISLPLPTGADAKSSAADSEGLAAPDSPSARSLEEAALKAIEEINNQDGIERTRLSTPNDEKALPASGGITGLSTQHWEPKTFRDHVKVVVRSQRFEMIVSFLIVVNSAVIAGEVEWEAEHLHDETPALFTSLTTFFAITFFVELVLRVVGEGKDFFMNRDHVPDLCWNWFDTILVLSSMVEVGIFVHRYVTGDFIYGAASLSNMRIVRVIRIFRVTRLMRLLRFVHILKFVRALSILILSITSTMKSLVWAVLLLAGIFYFFGILFTQAINEFLSRDDMYCTPDVLDGRDLCYVLSKYWGSIPRSMLTLFEAIAGGCDWGNVSRPLEDVGMFWFLVFLAFIAFCYLAVLNVVTGVFVQSAIENAQHNREWLIQQLMSNKQMYVDTIQDQFRSMFDLFDADRSGTVTVDEFAEHLKDPQVQAYFALLELDTSDAFTLFKLLDEDGSCAVDAEEFVEGCVRLKGGARAIDLAKLNADTKYLGRKVGRIQEFMEARIPKYAVASGKLAAEGSAAAVTAAVSALREERRLMEDRRSGELSTQLSLQSLDLTKLRELQRILHEDQRSNIAQLKEQLTGPNDSSGQPLEKLRCAGTFSRDLSRDSGGAVPEAPGPPASRAAPQKFLA